MITVTNKYKPLVPRQGVKLTTIYCGRGSALGNPFILTNLKDRDRVCNNYQTWLPAMLDNTDEDMRAQRAKMRLQLNKILEASLIGDVHLQCFCAPARCHCDTIKTTVIQAGGLRF